ncbi:MAG: hypothetical protein Fur0043_22940 [Anaerolineales bacterium]
MQKMIPLILILAIFLAACAPVASPTQDVEDVVQATLQAMTAQASIATATVSSAPGSITGTLGYPSEGLPAMRVTAFDQATKQAYYVDTVLNQNIFRLEDLPPGEYLVVAYSLGDGGFPVGLVGGYTQYIVCGAQPNCTDHSLAPVTVLPGEDTFGIHIGDWPLEEGTYPPMPGN